MLQHVHEPGYACFPLSFAAPFIGSSIKTDVLRPAGTLPHGSERCGARA